MPLFAPEGMGDYRTQEGRVIRLPDSVATYLGLSRAPVDDPVYPPESGGADPTAWGGQPEQGAPTIAQGVVDGGQFAADAARRAALPANVRDGTYFTDDNADTSRRKPPAANAPIVAQASSLGLRSGTAYIGQQGPTDIYAQPGIAAPQFSADDRAFLQQAGGTPANTSPEQTSAQTQPAPETADTLRKGGVAGVYNEQRSALADEEQAGRAMAEKEAAAQMAIANAFVKRNDEIDQQLQQRATEATRMNAAIDQRMAEYDTAVNKYADSKTDRTVDHPIMAAISAVLGMVGGVINKDGTNPTLDLLQKQIERKVNLQLAERDKLGQVASMKRGDIDMLRQRASDRTAQLNLVMAGETEKAARQIEAIGARSNSEIVRQRAAVNAAQLRQKSAAMRGDAVMAQQAKDDRDRAFEQQAKEAALADKRRSQEIGLGYANLGQRKYEFGEDMKFKREQLEQEAKKIAATGDLGQAKEVIERGIGGVVVPVKDADGNVIGAQRDLLRNPDGTPFIPTGSTASVDKLRDTVAATDTLVQLMDEAMRIRSGWSSDTAKSKEWQDLQTNWAAATGIAKDVLGLGVLSGPDMKLIGEFIGTSDPTQYRDPTPGIKKARQNLLTIANSKLHAANYKGDYNPPNLGELNGPRTTEEDAKFKDVLKDPYREKSMTDLNKEFPDESARIAKGGPDSAVAARQLQDRVGAIHTGHGILPSHKQILDGYAAIVADPNTKPGDRTRYLEMLTKAANTAQTNGVKEYASQLLANQTSAAVPSPTEDLGGPAIATSADKSKGGPAQTMSEQNQNDAMRTNVMKSFPLERVVQGVTAGDEASIAELRSRAMAKNADTATKQAYLRFVQTRK